MTLALIQTVEWMPVVHCDICEQAMPADHENHINSEAAPDAPGAASDPTKET